MNSGTGLNLLQKAEPDHYFDVGIAEQQAVLFAAGLALEGAKPVCAIYSTFLQRAFDQIVHDVCLQKLNVVFAMDRAGLVGDDGPTHHGAFDIAYLRCLPNIVAHGPARRGDARAHAAHRADLRRRPDRAALPARRGRRRARCRGADRADRDRHAARSCARATRVALVGYGSGVQKALEAADLLAEGGLERHRRRRALRQAARRRRCSRSWPPSTSCSSPSRRACWPAASAPRSGRRLNDGGRHVPRILRVGLPDRYVTHGKPALLHAEVGFTGKAIAQRIEAAIAAGSGALAGA